MSSYIIVSQDELYHHGVKGMHWGVRRYQNVDGSLTDKGRARLAKLDRKMTNKGMTIINRGKQIEKLRKTKVDTSRMIKLQGKKDALTRKRDKLLYKNSKSRAKLDVGKSISGSAQRRLQKEAKLNQKIDKITSQQSGMYKAKAKIDKLESLNKKTAKEIEKLAEKYSKVEAVKSEITPKSAAWVEGRRAKKISELNYKNARLGIERELMTQKAGRYSSDSDERKSNQMKVNNYKIEKMMTKSRNTLKKNADKTLKQALNYADKHHETGNEKYLKKSVALADKSEEYSRQKKDVEYALARNGYTKWIKDDERKRRS